VFETNILLCSTLGTQNITVLSSSRVPTFQRNFIASILRAGIPQDSFIVAFPLFRSILVYCLHLQVGYVIGHYA
jgi:hypothetical protein